MKQNAKNGGQTFLHILAIFQPTLFCKIKNVVDLELLNITDNSGLVCSHYLSF